MTESPGGAERLPKEWVRHLESLWEALHDPEELIDLRSGAEEPIDEYIWAALVRIRRTSFALMLRIDAYRPADDQEITEEGRQVVREAMRLTARARNLLGEAIGIERVNELESQARPDRGPS